MYPPAILASGNFIDCVCVNVCLCVYNTQFFLFSWQEWILITIIISMMKRNDGKLWIYIFAEMYTNTVLYRAHPEMSREFFRFFSISAFSSHFPWVFCVLCVQVNVENYVLYIMFLLALALHSSLILAGKLKGMNGKWSEWIHFVFILPSRPRDVILPFVSLSGKWGCNEIVLRNWMTTKVVASLSIIQSVGRKPFN